MTNWLDIQDKVYVVTGGSSGIGASIVQRLLEVGAKVANFDLVDQENQNESYLFVKVDVTSSQEIEQGIQAVLDKFGTIDGLVNNAGINIPALLVDDKNPKSKYEINEGLFDKMISINMKGFYMVAQAVARILVDKGQGVLINMGSEAGLEGSEGQSCYAATKAAVYSFTRSWAKELGKKGVRVVGVAPGIMEATGLRTDAYEEALSYTRNITVDDLRKSYAKTTTTPLGRSGKLSEVADTVCFLLSERAGYITGVTLNIAGGKTRG
ncbi:D-sorbitol 6-phosphate 2-dehydrogenase [Ignavigranum ruoffiae]|uniref:D-sorbitol 6-phosphate 2-dehydrogenase n=1 Tax=Ignavigranum ruoffiae TaxID=89093 RepID=A0A1H9F1E8_9LACT|nr:SDR family oxidoreductase [Ignavigranum ruoffiae]SEQ31800.1 D-sorbitol 6-phosphate 2-dehydrogenase [Ignavigranum ruoffiae]